MKKLKKIEKDKLQEKFENEINSYFSKYRDYLDWFDSLSESRQEEEYKLLFKESILDVQNYIKDRPREHGDAIEKFTTLRTWLEQNLIS